MTRSDQSSVVVVMAELQVNLLQQRRCRAIARRGGQGPSMDGCGGSCGARWLVDAERTPKLALLPVGHTRTTVIENKTSFLESSDPSNFGRLHEGVGVLPGRVMSWPARSAAERRVDKLHDAAMVG